MIIRACMCIAYNSTFLPLTLQVVIVVRQHVLPKSSPEEVKLSLDNDKYIYKKK